MDRGNVSLHTEVDKNWQIGKGFKNQWLSPPHVIVVEILFILNQNCFPVFLSGVTLTPVSNWILC